MSGDTLGSLGLTWYSHIDPDETVEIVNTLRERAAAGETVFYDIYTDAGKGRRPGQRGHGPVLLHVAKKAHPSPCATRAVAFAYVGRDAGQLPARA